ncbi:class I SAM-dependent methyltransferase [Flavihumibacter profundi]|uniref:class I SAM-dependent methyltransferase n=1 Tax=Flavihumibacter profundi TaxID=2716883 RepID=UPI001CC63B51|nr:class I SAM-dependent methyltransferase [Flavihumibacter profundi]MBZ5857972.1 methyltransferase domain-containing protein [Flavihumibacter profundi]
MGIVQKVLDKYDNWGYQLKNKGVSRIIQEKAFEYGYKLKFKSIGVNHTSFIKNVEESCAKATHKDVVRNEASYFYYIFKGLKNLAVEYSQLSLLDFGCGSGRILSVGMVKGFKKVVGVDIDEQSAQKAMHNCKILQEKGFTTPYEVYCDDATRFPIPAGTNLIYLFNPFGDKTMKEVIEKIISYCRGNRQDVYIIYYFPLLRHLFDATGLFSTIFSSQYKNKNTDIIIYKIGAEDNKFYFS